MASGQKDFLLSLIRDGKEMTFGQQLKLTMLLAVPAILAQFSSVLMLYIDTAMVGHLDPRGLYHGHRLGFCCPGGAHVRRQEL